MSYERVVQRAEVRIDLRHQVPGQESETFAGLDRRTGEDDPLHLLGLQRLHRHRHGEPRLARTGGADAERDDVVLDGLDVALLPARLGTHRPSPGPPQHVVGQHLARPLVGGDHLDHPGESDRVEVMAALQEVDELFEQPPDLVGLLTANADLVAAHADLGAGKGVLDLSEVLISGTDECGHQLRARHDDGRRCSSCRHVVVGREGLSIGEFIGPCQRSRDRRLQEVNRC